MKKAVESYSALNLKTLEYEPAARTALPSLVMSKQIDDLSRRINALFDAEDKGGEFTRKAMAGLFAYVSHRVPEISDSLFAIDQAIKAGFAWKLGPFETWDVVGIQKGIDVAQKEGYEVAQWVKDIAKQGETFYSIETGTRQYYQLSVGYTTPKSADGIVNLDNQPDKELIYSNDEVAVHDIGDQVLCLEFRTKANAIGQGILQGVVDTIQLAEEGDWRGLVLGNHATNFSVGVNLMLMAMFAFEEEWDDLEMAIRLFQQATMRCRYSNIPVVAATQGYVFGGGCETVMHCDAVCASAESYIGLVEAGVGVLPAAGGTKEFALRASDAFFEGDVMVPTLIEKFRTIALATVSTSAHEAFDHGYLLDNKDRVIINGKYNITEAKKGSYPAVCWLCRTHSTRRRLCFGKIWSRHFIRGSKRIISWQLCFRARHKDCP